MENVTTEGKNGKYTRYFNGICGATCCKAYLKHIISLKNTLKSVGGYFLRSGPQFILLYKCVRIDSGRKRLWKISPVSYYDLIYRYV